jgi:hypothetical protein
LKKINIYFFFCFFHGLIKIHKKYFATLLRANSIHLVLLGLSFFNDSCRFDFFFNRHTPMYVVTDDLRLTAVRCLTIRLKDLTPQHRAYLTLLEVRGRVVNHRQGQRQAFVVPFPHAIPEATADHLQLAGMQDSKEAIALFNVFARLFPVPSTTTTGNQLPVGAQAHGVGLHLFPSLNAMRHGMDWTPYVLAGDFERTLAALKTHHGDSCGYAVLDTTVNRTTADVGGVAGWVWFGQAAVVPAGTNRTTFPLQAWIINDYGTQLTSSAQITASVSPILPGSKTDVLRTMLESIFVGPADMSRPPSRLQAPAVRQVMSIAGTAIALLPASVENLALGADLPVVTDPKPEPPPVVAVEEQTPPPTRITQTAMNWQLWLVLLVLLIIMSSGLVIMAVRRWYA